MLSLYASAILSFSGQYPVDIRTNEVYYCAMLHPDGTAEVFNWCEEPSQEETPVVTKTNEGFSLNLLSQEESEAVVESYNKALCEDYEFEVWASEQAFNAAFRTAFAFHPEDKNRSLILDDLDTLIKESVKKRNEC